MKKKLFGYIALIALIIVNPIAAQCADSILIGLNTSLTGSRQASGENTKRGADLLKEQLNKDGGIQVGGKKYQVEFLYEDNQSKLEPGVKAALDLISKKRVLAFIGPNSSSRAIPIGGIAQSFKAPMVSPASTNPKTTANRPFVFRACFIDSFQGAVMAKFAMSEFKAERAAVLFDIDNAYPRGLAGFFKQTFEAEKGTGSITDASFQTDSSNLSSQIDAIKKAGVQVVFIPQYSYQVPAILKQIRDAGWDGPVLGGAAWGAADLMEKCGDLCKGAFFSAHFTPNGAKGKAKDFVDSYQEKYKLLPDGYSALGYDAASLITTAISRLDAINPNLFAARSEVKEKLATIQNFEGVSGTLDMANGGDPKKSALIIKISDSGQFESYNMIQP